MVPQPSSDTSRTIGREATAVVVTEPGDRSVLAVHQVDVPPPGEGEAQIEVAAAGVNFIDVYRRQGVYPTPTPFVLGAEGAGRVVEAGAGSRWQVGDRVAWAMGAASQATYVNQPDANLVRVPDEVALDVAAAAMLQGLTANYLITSTFPIAAGDIALVHAAAGGVGQLLVQWITSKGATVVATAGSAEKLEIAAQRGAQHLVNYTEHTGDDLAAAVRDAAGRGVDVAYDGVGKATFKASLESLRPRGMGVLFGGASGQVEPFDLQLLNQLGSLFVTRPTLANYIAEREEYEARSHELFTAIADGTLQIDIGGRYAFADVAEAYAALEGRASTGKLILTPDGK